MDGLGKLEALLGVVGCHAGRWTCVQQRQRGDDASADTGCERGIEGDTPGRGVLSAFPGELILVTEIDGDVAARAETRREREATDSGIKVRILSKRLAVV